MRAREKRLFQHVLFLPSVFALLILAAASAAYAATVTIHFPAANSIQNAAIAGDGNNITINVSVSVTVNDGNVSALNLSYRATSSGAWSSIGDNTTFNLTQEAGNHTYTFPWNISSLTDGTTYELNATAVNDTNIIGDTTVTGITLDHTNPAVTIETLDAATFKSKTTVFFTDKILLRCKRSDATAGFNDTNISLLIPGGSAYKQLTQSAKSGGATSEAFDFTYSDTTTLGKHTAICAAYDKAGNANFSINATFEVVVKPPPGSSPFIDPNFVPPVATIIIGAQSSSHIGDLTELGISRLMAKTAEAVFTIDGEDYAVFVKEIVGDVATYTIADSFDVEVAAGEVKQVDVDADGVDDVFIELHKIFSKKADTTFRLLVGQQPAAPVPSEPSAEVTPVVPPPAEEKTSWLVILLWVIVIILLIYVLLHFVAKRQRGGGMRPQGQRPAVTFTRKDLGAYREQGTSTYGTSKARLLTIFI